MDVSTRGNWQKDAAIGYHGRTLYRYIVTAQHDKKVNTRPFTKEMQGNLRNVVVFAGILARTYKYGDDSQSEGIMDVEGTLSIATVRVISDNTYDKIMIRGEEMQGSVDEEIEMA